MDPPSLIDVILTSQDNSNVSKICNSSSICDASDECDSASYDGGSLCCAALTSCHSKPNITISSVSNDYDVALRCDGHRSCKSSSGIYGTNGGDLYFSGKESAELGNIVSTNQSNIICSAEDSCKQATIRNALDVYCPGDESCAKSIISNVRNVFGYSWRSIQEAIISDVDNVYCASIQSCFPATISNVADTVYAAGRRSLRNSIIKNATNVCPYFSISYACGVRL